MAMMACCTGGFLESAVSSEYEASGRSDARMMQMD